MMKSLDISVQRLIFIGTVALLVLIVGLGGWAVMTEISGALVAPGQIVVDSNVKKVQHLSGGVVGEINVVEGELVKKGDILLRLDDTKLRASIGIVRNTLDEMAARSARLESERDGGSKVTFPSKLLARHSDPRVAEILLGEKRLFKLRLAAREGQKKQLFNRLDQIDSQIEGFGAQQKAKTAEIVLIHRELDGMQELWEKKLVPLIRVNSLEREATRLEGEQGQLVASIAEARDKIAEIHQQMIQIDQNLASEVANQLREIGAKRNEYIERKVAGEDELRRVNIRAPQDGFVHELSAHTIGGVVSPGEPIMLIVPINDALTVEVRVLPQDIDRLSIGQLASLHFTSFDAKTTPQIEGHVVRISPNTSTDERSGNIYYTARIAMSPDQIARLGDVQLVPGMVVESFIKTGDRTVASYLVKPLMDQVSRAFREG